MPTAYHTPGVYVEWLDANAQQIELGRTDITGFVGLADRGPVQAPVKIESLRQFTTTFGDQIVDGYLAYAVAGFFENGGRTCWVVRAADPGTAVPARARLCVEGRDPFVLEAISPGAWGDRIALEAVWGPDRITHVIARTPDDREQTIDLDRLGGAGGRDPSVQTNLLGVDDDQLQERTADRIVVDRPDDPGLPPQALDAVRRTARLDGGDDGLGAFSPDLFTGDLDGLHEWGVVALERVDEVSIVAVPDLMAGQLPGPRGTIRGFSRDVLVDAQTAIVNSCIRRRDRMAVLDMPPFGRREAIASMEDRPRTSFAAIYHPWIVVANRIAGEPIARHVPPSGHIAGMYARVDRLRGVHKPPANERLEGVFDVREPLDDQAHADLNDSSINAIRSVPGRGILPLGVRTLDPNLQWRYVNVRRLFLAIEDALDEQLQWLTFEPNNPRLWRQVDRTVRGLLERMYRAGMLDGATADDAFAVRCDESTNPPFETDEGRVTCTVGIQPPYPAEFVVVRIGVTRSGIEVVEKGAQDV